MITIICMTLARFSMIMATNDYRSIIRDGIGDEIATRWPHLNQSRIECQRPDSHGNICPQIQLGLPDDCGYAHIYIMCGEDIFIDADGFYGPQMQFRYEDHDCVENILAFILAILNRPRIDGKRLSTDERIIDLREWRMKL